MIDSAICTFSSYCLILFFLYIHTRCNMNSLAFTNYLYNLTDFLKQRLLLLKNIEETNNGTVKSKSRSSLSSGKRRGRIIERSLNRCSGYFQTRNRAGKAGGSSISKSSSSWRQGRSRSQAIRTCRLPACRVEFVPRPGSDVVSSFTWLVLVHSRPRSHPLIRDPILIPI